MSNDTAATPSQSEASVLRVGWRVSDDLQPRYWLYADDPQQGGQDDSHLFTIPAPRVANHAAVIAQSGSGKSFFLGRLIEEILLRTKARCIILDPNADFRRVSDVVDDKLWSGGPKAYDKTKRLGKITTEPTRAAFEENWAKIDKAVFGLGFSRDGVTHPLRLPWASLSVDFLGEDVSPTSRADLYHCHDFVKTVYILFKHGSYCIIDSR